MSARKLAVLLVCAVLGATPCALAQTWSGQGANSNWDYNTGFPFNWYSNWSGNALPAVSANVSFGSLFSSGNPNLKGNRTVGRLTINAFTGFTIEGSGNTLSLGTGALDRSASTLGVQILSCNVDLRTNANWTIDGPEASGHLRISGVITDSPGPFSLQKGGAGTVIFSNANTYDGNTTINAGKLLADNTTGSATGSAPVSVASAGTLGGKGFIAGATSVSSGGVVSPGTLAQPAAQLTFNGGLILDGGAVLSFDLGNTSDSIRIAGGAYTHSGAVSVNVAQGGGLAPGQTYTIVNFAGAAPSSIDAGDFALATTPIAGVFAVVGSTVEFRTLAVPLGLVAVAAGQEINLNWADNLEAGVTYNVYRGTTAGFTADVNSRIANGVALSSHADIGLSENTTYYYKVTAVDSYGNESLVSSEAAATTENIPGIIYVDDSAAPGGDGSSWTLAYQSLQSALSPSAAGDQIWVAGGTYLPGGARASTFALKSNVRIYGGFRGLAGDEGNFAARSLTSNETVLSGDIPSFNCYHVVTAASVTGAVLDGFTIAFGQANGSPGAATNRGAGIFVSSASPLLANCTFRDNTALVGGAVNKEGSGTAGFINCVFRNNSATSFYGAAVFVSGGGSTLANCTISGNASASGGAVYIQGSTAQLSNCILWGNTGGTLASVAGSSSTVTYSCIQGGFAGTGNINVDPRFVNAGAGDLHIQPSSNCVEAGSPTLPADSSDMDGDADTAEAIPLDRDGNARVIGAVADMGAYEVLSPDSPPAAPTGLTASLASSTQVNLNWNDSPEADLSGYNVYRGATPSFPLNASTRIAADVVLSQQVDTVVDDGSMYYYVVTAKDTAGGESLPSQPAVSLNTQPGAPTGLTAAGQGSTGMQVDWADNPEPDIASYSLYRSIVPGFTPAAGNLVAEGLATSSFADAGLLDGRTYYYRAIAFDLAGNQSPLSGEASGLTVSVPGILYVVSSSPVDGDGGSWSTAFPSLQTAITASRAGDEIWVAEGTYKPAAAARAAAFVLRNNVAIYGGFPGIPGQEGDFHVRSPEAHISLLSGDVGAVGHAPDNSYHVVVSTGTDATAVLDGFTIAHGYASGAPNPNHENAGGGIFNWNGSPTIRNCIFHSHVALVGAGAINQGSTATFENCDFYNNSTGGGGNSGGGMYNEFSAVKIRNCAFYANHAGQGGAVYNGSSTAGTSFVNCLFSGNDALAGGATCNESIAGNTTPSFINCTFSHNTSTAGGALFNKYAGSAPTVTNSILWGNTPSSIANSNGSVGGPVTYSCIQGGYGGTENILDDPAFVDEDGADNTYGTVDDDLRVQPGSPAINAGNNAAVPAGITIDFYGTPRILGAAVDMGIYEAIPPIRFDYDHDGDVDLADFATFAGCNSGPALPRSEDFDCFASDADDDGDVDHDDFGEFQRCYSGPDQAPALECVQVPS